MNRRPPDDLTSSLKDLTGPGASEGFTERVLEGLDRRVRRRRRVRASGIAAAGVLAATLVAVAVSRQPEPTELTGGRSLATAEDIRREHSMLLDELEQLRRSRALAPEVVYLGGSEDYDLVLDLSPLLDQMTRPASTPASFTPGTRPVEAGSPPRRKP